MAKKKQAGRRANGEGSIYFREDKNLWCCSVPMGFDNDGNRKRKIIYGKTSEELIEKKKELEASLTTGTYIEPTNMTFEQYLERWFQMFMKLQ